MFSVQLSVGGVPVLLLPASYRIPHLIPDTPSCIPHRGMLRSQSTQAAKYQQVTSSNTHPSETTTNICSHLDLLQLQQLSHPPPTSNSTPIQHVHPLSMCQGTAVNTGRLLLIYHVTSMFETQPMRLRRTRTTTPRFTNGRYNR